jgi:hypothetical protein
MSSDIQEITETVNSFRERMEDNYKATETRIIYVRENISDTVANLPPDDLVASMDEFLDRWEGRKWGN